MTRPSPRRAKLGRSVAVAALCGLTLTPALATAQAFPTSSLRASASSRPGRLAGAPVRTIAAPAPVYQQESYPASYDQVSPQTVRVDTGAGAARTLSLPRGKSAVVELPTDARDVMVSDPNVADVVLSTPRRIYVMGKGSGQTDALFVDGMGRQILRLAIRVDQDVAAVAQTMSRLLPGSAIRVEAANDTLILSGEAANASEADRAVRLAQSFVTQKDKIVNLIAVSGSEQVMLKVKIVEVNRTVTKQLGFDLSAVLGQLGGPQYGFAKAATYGVAGALLGGLTGGYAADTTKQVLSPTSTATTAAAGFTTAVQTDALGRPIVVNGVAQTYLVPTNSATSTLTNTGLSSSQSTVTSGLAGSSGLNSAQARIEAFERVGLVRTLAEPNLTAISGESARFLVGGEFPIPVSQDSTGRISLEFKPFGVGLGFTPVVLGTGRISLKISTEVSELTSVGAFTLSTSTTNANGSTTNSPGLSVPGLNVRRVETVVELPSGGAMMIGGLMQSTSRQTLDSLPGLMQLPILGSLFRSRDFQNNETELVVIVTPYLVKAARPDQMQTPADGLVIASDIETNLLGRLNSASGKKAQAVANKTYQGPFGYVVD